MCCPGAGTELARVTPSVVKRPGVGITGRAPSVGPVIDGSVLDAGQVGDALRLGRYIATL